MKQTGTDMRKFLSRAAWMAAGAVLFFSALPLRAATTANCVISVTPVPSTLSAVTLTAFRSNVEGQVNLMWTVPADWPLPINTDNYEVRYATYPANWLSVAPSASFPENPALNAGDPESFPVNGLTGGTTYYFALRRQAAGPIYSPFAQAQAVPKGILPAPVAGLSVPDNGIDVSWLPVAMNEDGTAMQGGKTVTGYVVGQSTIGWNGPFTVLPSTSGFITSGTFMDLSVPTTTQYLQILAKDSFGNLSDPAFSNILEVTNSGIIGQMGVGADGLSRAYVPSPLMGELAPATGPLLIHLSTVPALNQDPRTLKTYNVSFITPVISPAPVVDKNFTFSRPAMIVTLAYPALAGAEVGVLWWNGTAWIKIAAEVNELNGTVRFYTALPGVYQVKMFQAATSLTMDKAGVFPRIFTPNGDGINDVVYFVIENPNHSEVDGKIYDVGGNEVATLRPAGVGAPTADTLVWDGRDRNGSTDHAGVYVYRIKGEGKRMTGTVVVAK